jgi:hypothetical protein
MNNIKTDYDIKYKKLSTSLNEQQVFNLWKKKIKKEDLINNITYECPPELKPINNICPTTFPKIIDNCCSKDFNSIKKYKCNMKESKYVNIINSKKNIQIFSEIKKMVNLTKYNDLQKNIIKLYSQTGYDLLSKFTKNDFKIDLSDTKINNNFRYISNFIQNRQIDIGTNLDINNPLNYQRFSELFFSKLNSCFIYTAETNIIVYRGLDRKILYQKGTFIQSKIFMSTSINKNYVINHFAKSPKYTFITIYIPKGSKICPFFDISIFSQEEEILLKYGSVFYVKNIKETKKEYVNGKTKIILEGNEIELVLIDGDYTRNLTKINIQKVGVI